MGRAHRAFAAFQAQVQAVPVMAGGADGEGVLAPFGELVQGLPGVHFQADAQAMARFGQDL
ncbi:hypothetical protein D3C81_1632650 [compost metagenome]